MQVVNKPWLILSAAIVMGGVGTFLANRHIHDQIDAAKASVNDEQKKKTQVVVVKADYPRGAQLTKDDLAVREIDETFANADMVSPGKYEDILSRRLILPMHNGQPVQWGFLDAGQPTTFSGQVPPGMRALTFQVDDINSVSGMIVPGDKIDLLASIKRSESIVILPLLQNVRVLATGQATAATDSVDLNVEKRGFNTLTLQLSPEDAEKLVIAQENGKLTAILRHPDDNRLIATSSVDISKILGRKENIVTQRSRLNVDARTTQQNEPMADAVPVIYGGMGNGRPTPANIRVPSSKAKANTSKANAKISREMIDEVAENIISGVDFREPE
ncbi:MAG: Flp pilus assembly protein CpaB [Pseudomonadota bacterium]